MFLLLNMFLNCITKHIDIARISRTARTVTPISVSNFKINIQKGCI